MARQNPEGSAPQGMPDSLAESRTLSPSMECQFLPSFPRREHGPLGLVPFDRHLGLLALFLLGCSDEKIVYREPVNPPPDANSGFLGYFTATDKQTTCGNCHVGHQRAWLNTAHADAYATLANSGRAQTFCYSCHTVSDKGNATAGPAGWEAVQDAAYHDVQCESCHGPGNIHVQEPDAAPSANNPPLAHVGVLGRTPTRPRPRAAPTATAVLHHPFVDEWDQSAHARSLEEEPGDVRRPTTRTAPRATKARRRLRPGASRRITPRGARPAAPTTWA